VTVLCERLILIAVTLAAALAAGWVSPVAVIQRAGPCAEARIAIELAVSARAALLATLIAPATFAGNRIIRGGPSPP
jgi:hypothetical protein